MSSLPLIWRNFIPIFFKALARRIRGELRTALNELQQLVQSYWGDPNFPSPLDLEILQIFEEIEALENQTGDIQWSTYDPDA